MIVLSVFVYLANPSARTNRYFALFVAFLVLFITCNFLENEPNIVGMDNVDVFLRLDFFFAILMFYAWLRFAYVFSEHRIKFFERMWVFPSIFVSGLVIAFLSLFTDLILKDIYFDKDVIAFSDGVLWPIYALYILGPSFAGLVLLYLGKRAAKKRNNTAKAQQINLVFIGFYIALGNLIFINLLIQTFIPISLDLSRIGIYGMVVLVAFTSYAIIKHHFFDVRLILIRSATFLILASILTGIYGFILIQMALLLTGEKPSVSFIILSVILTAGAAASFTPLYRKLAEYTSRTFYKSYYDSEKLLAELTHVMVTDLEIKDMTTNILTLLTSKLHISWSALQIAQKEMGYNTTMICAEGCDPGTTFSLTDEENMLFQTMCRPNSPLTKEMGIILFRNLPDGKEKELLRKHDISIIIPIRVSKQNVAFLILGPKLSGEVYTDQDIEFLSIFAGEAGIAIQNAQSVKEIKRFNEELEVMIDERTIELKQAQKRELEKAQDVARLKDEFVFIATHELRAPITAIRLFLEMATAKTAKMPKPMQENMDSIVKASDHLNHLIDDLLEVARSEAGSMKVAVQEMNLLEVLNHILDELKSTITQKNITLTLHNSLASTSVMADPSKTKEIVTNIISNAVKYNRDNGTIDITLLDINDQIVVEVKDTGFGIPADQQERIFEKFFRASSKDTENIVGTGLGMFITRMLVEKMGGKVAFSSVEGEGTTMAFSLPKTSTS